jgi:hypothetical protein
MKRILDKKEPDIRIEHSAGHERVASLRPLLLRERAVLKMSAGSNGGGFVRQRTPHPFLFVERRAALSLRERAQIHPISGTHKEPSHNSLDRDAAVCPNSRVQRGARHPMILIGQYDSPFVRRVGIAPDRSNGMPFRAQTVVDLRRCGEDSAPTIRSPACRRW